MGLLSKLKKLLDLGPKKEELKVQVTCDHCGQELDSIFRKNYDLQPSYGSETYEYLVNKELVCPGCYKSLNLKLELDSSLGVLKSQLQGGELTLESEQ
ncbi:hypothetical protein JCM16358_04820 [Halanaerocella petrolearia]